MPRGNGGVIGVNNDPITELVTTFTSSGTFTSRPTTVNAGVVVIGGGGGGGNIPNSGPDGVRKGGGGGSGGVVLVPAPNFAVGGGTPVAVSQSRSTSRATITSTTLWCITTMTTTFSD